MLAGWPGSGPLGYDRLPFRAEDDEGISVRESGHGHDDHTWRGRGAAQVFPVLNRAWRRAGVAMSATPCWKRHSVAASPQW